MSSQNNRRLNAVTRQDAFPLPRAQDCIDTVRGSVYFSTFDLTSGYMNDQGPVKEEQPLLLNKKCTSLQQCLWA